mmetsp:Transcript_48394/g.65876  ORF Transcript_48394/g.65876 Transcript_48394/m.65876 type:complete len:237 (+) Transcript_48394:1455-2165(+)
MLLRSCDLSFGRSCCDAPASGNTIDESRCFPSSWVMIGEKRTGFALPFKFVLLSSESDSSFFFFFSCSLVFLLWGFPGRMGDRAGDLLPCDDDGGHTDDNVWPSPPPPLPPFLKFRKGALRRTLVVDLFIGSCWQHALMKASASSEMDTPSMGGRSPLAIWYMAAIGLGNMGQGIFPVSISMTVHPMLHTSALIQPWDVCCPLITSGAIQCGVPFKPLTREFASTRFEAPKSASLQ